MKTGNAVLAVFSFWMAFTFPFTAIDIIKTNNLESMISVSTGVAGLIVFCFFALLGIVALAYGREHVEIQKTYVREQPISKEALRKITSDEKTDDLFK